MKNKKSSATLLKDKKSKIKGNVAEITSQEPTFHQTHAQPHHGSHYIGQEMTMLLYSLLVWMYIALIFFSHPSQPTGTSSQYLIMTLIAMPSLDCGNNH